MKKIFSLVIFVLLSVSVFSQEFTVRFVGSLNDSQYLRLDSVSITDVTRNWTETLVYPDTSVVVNSTVNVYGNELQSDGFEQNVPNPFDCYTSVELSIPQDENVKLQLFDAAGRQCAELNVALNAGSHRFEITASKPQTYILKAVVSAKTYSVRMINMGSCGGDGIKYGGYAGLNAKLTIENEFAIGDEMEYVGYANIEGDVVESEIVSLSLRESQDIVLNFTRSLPPQVETLSATNVQESTATLNGNIISDGSSPITSCGFVYGIGSNNLSKEVICSSLTESFSADIADLPDGAICYYKAFATNNAGRGYGETKTFLTYTSLSSQVSTVGATNVFATSAILLGEVVWGQDAFRGFLYGTSENSMTNDVRCGSGVGIYATTLANLNAETTYYYKTYATFGVDTAYGEVLSFITGNAETIGSLNGHTWIDLGLPSGTLWAINDIGSCRQEGRGNYFAWGDTVPKESRSARSWASYCYCNGTDTSLTKYCNDPAFGANGFVDTLTVLEPSDDAATVNWGEGWRMPTMAEYEELLDNCTDWSRVDLNGEIGLLYIGTTGNSIFLPNYYPDFLGYWTSSLYTSDPRSARYFFSTPYYWLRYNELPVRAVYDSDIFYSYEQVAPVVTTAPVNVVSPTEFVLVGSAFTDGISPVLSRGFLYGTSENDLNIEVQCGDGFGDFSATLTNLVLGTTYFYKAYATNSVGTSYGNVQSFVFGIVSPATGSDGNHGYVDLGLPSGMLWATCNVGADIPEGVGDYFAWGETSPKEIYDWSTYRWCNGSRTTLTKYCGNPNYGYNGYTDDLSTLEPSDDAATVNWGENWRTPTRLELRELTDNCTTVYIEFNGVVGRLLTGPNGNTIFLPNYSPEYNVGHYWSSTLGASYAPTTAWELYFDSHTCTMDNSASELMRYLGTTVRPVYVNTGR